jgi:Response receiver domain
MASLTFDNLVIKAVERFLQSAVVVDDRAFLPSAIQPTRLRTPTREAETLAEIEEETTQGSVSDSEVGDPANTPLNAKEIVDAFAARGVVCGVLRPSADEADAVRLVAPRAIRRSDLIIVDWHLHGDDGEATIALLRDVVQEAGEAMRLVAVYTGDPDLPRVARRLVQQLGGSPIDDTSVEIGSVRIVVIGKADPDAPKAGAVSEGELPDRLVTLYAALADGLVRAAALSALGAQRGATYRLLAGLGPEIDLGYVGQRALQSQSSEAEEHLFGMLVSELRAIVEDDEETRACIDANAVASWLKRESDEGRGGPISYDALAVAVECDPYDDDAVRTLRKAHAEFNGINLKKGLTERIAATPDAARSADERFAMRMSLKLVHERPERILSVGTIVADQEGRYWLCIQPACDSLRIKGARRFPFVPLTVVTSRVDYVIDDEGGVQYLRLSRKPADIKHWTFEADSALRAVVAKGGLPAFVTTSRRTFRWVGQLNEAHAQRAAQDIGAEQSRVGLAESDWLRNMAK